MKKLVSLVLAGILGASLFAFVGCGNKEKGVLDEVVAEGQGLTTEQLYEKAKTETGNFIAYGNTSRITTAYDNFKKAYPELTFGSNSGATKLNDSQIYKNLETEEKAPDKAKNASVVLIQDSATLQQYINNSKILTNYVPKGMEDKVDEGNRVPLAHQFINKLFMYNTVGDSTAQFTNVWQLTDISYNGKIFFKSPVDEQVNMNFLIMLTSKEWSDKLEAAYKTYHNSTAATDIGTGTNQYKNYGYKWIAEFLANCNFSITSDTTIAGTLSKASNAGKMGLFVLSKLRDASVYGENLAVSAWDKEAGATEYTKIDPFAGFMYSIYAQLATYGPRPYTAMLFVNYLMTAEGFEPWKSLGGYSANKTVPVYSGNVTTPVEREGKLVYLDNNKAEMYADGKVGDNKKYTYFDGSGSKVIGDKITVDGAEVDFKVSQKTTVVKTVQDSPISFWQDTLVVENGTYILSVKADLVPWITSKIPGTN